MVGFRGAGATGIGPSRQGQLGKGLVADAGSRAAARSARGGVVALAGSRVLQSGDAARPAAAAAAVGLDAGSGASAHPAETRLPG